MNKNCDYCSKPLRPEPRAQHKRFCNNGCRQKWHHEQRAQVMEELRARREAKLAQESEKSGG